MTPLDSVVIVEDFPGIVSSINRTDVKRSRFLESQRLFESLLSGAILRPADYGPWHQHIDALYAEVRAVLLGRAVPGASNTIEMPNGMVRLTDQSYIALRGGKSALGREAASFSVEAYESVLRPCGVRRSVP